MTDTIDLDAYFARIGYTGSREPTRETLNALHLLHPAAIPFENLDPVLGRPVNLDIESLTQKLIRGGRGGYCFEQNGIFLRVLQALGFEAWGLSARVLLGRTEAYSPRSHMLIQIMLDGEALIADVGFGSQVLTAPLKLSDERPQVTPHGEFRLVRADDEYEQHYRSNGAWEALYRFSLQRQMMQDYEALNWYRATHPQSHFVNNIIAVRAVPGRKLSLLNSQFTVRDVTGGEPVRRVLQTGSDIAAVLEQEFGITLPEPRAETIAALERFTAYTSKRGV